VVRGCVPIRRRIGRTRWARRIRRDPVPKRVPNPSRRPRRSGGGGRRRCARQVPASSPSHLRRVLRRAKRRVHRDERWKPPEQGPNLGPRHRDRGADLDRGANGFAGSQERRAGRLPRRAPLSAVRACGRRASVGHARLPPPAMRRDRVRQPPAPRPRSSPLRAFRPSPGAAGSTSRPAPAKHSRSPRPAAASSWLPWIHEGCGSSKLDSAFT
jgi:hypothetical protein